MAVKTVRKYRKQKHLKLNIGCGRDIKKGFLNIDQYQRENKLDLILDVTKGLPFKNESCSYIYAEQFVEHLNWLDGLNFLKECHRCLEKGGTLRLVLPDYRKIFNAYVGNDKEFFEIYKHELNYDDHAYYSRVLLNPKQVKKERKEQPTAKMAHEFEREG